MIIFKNRYDAAEQLTEKLQKYKDRKDAIILAIPRGALQIGAVLAERLKLPLDIVLVKKIGHPYNPELAIGAVSLKEYVVNPEFREVSKGYIQSEVKELRHKLQKLAQQYRGEKAFPNLKNRIVILVDDGIAMGYTMGAAIDLVRKEKPKKVIVAIPVGSPEAVSRLQRKADEVICLDVPEFFMAIGQFYQQFEQVDDDEAIRLLKEANK